MRKILTSYFPIISIISLILLFIILIFSNSYILGSSIDWFKQSVSFYEYFRNLFYNTGNLFPDLALHIGGGQNIYYFIYYGLFSPYLLISYLFPFVKSGDFIMISNFLSVTMSTILFYYFLIKSHYKKSISLFSSFLFLLSAPILSMSLKHFMFIQYMPFLLMGLFGVKMYLDKNKSLLLVLNIILIITTSYYFSIPSIICLCLYALYYYIKINNNVNFINIFKTGFKYILRILLGIAIVSFLLLPVLYTIMNGRNTLKYILSIYDFLPQFNIKSLLYSSFGIGLTAIGFVALIYNILYGKKENRVLSICLLIIIIFPVFDVLLNGFLYRNSKVFIPFLPLFIILVADMICNLKFINKKRKWIIWIVCLLFLIGLNNEVITMKFLSCDLIGTFFLLYLYSKKDKLIFVLPFLGLSFLIASTNIYKVELMNIDEYNYLYKNLYTYEEMDVTDSIYRFHDDVNSQLLNYSDAISLYKTSIYSSTSNYIYNDIFDMEFANNIRHPVYFYTYQDRNLLFNRFMGVRYLLSERDVPYGYNVINEYDNGILYENKNVYSLGFSLSNLLNNDEYNELSYIEKLLSYQNNIIIDGNSNNSDLDFNYNKISLDYDVIDSENINVEKRDHHYIINSFGDGKLVLLLNKSLKNKTLLIRFNINNDSMCNSYLSKNGHLSISINGFKNVLSCVSDTYNNNKTFDYVISSNESISKLNISFYEGYYDISDIEVYTVDNSFFDENNTIPLVIDFDKTKGDHIYGNINVSKSGYFIFTIPYDKGYTVYVDGKKVEIEKVNGGFIGFKIEPGVHDIHLTFEAPYAKLGRLISLIGIIILTVLVIFERKNKKI